MEDLILKAEKVEFVEEIEHFKTSEGHGVHIHIDDHAIEQRAIQITAYEGIEKPEHKTKAEDHGNDLATKAVIKVLETLGAYDPKHEVAVQIHTDHEVEL